MLYNPSETPHNTGVSEGLTHPMVSLNQSAPGTKPDAARAATLAALLRLLDDASPVVRGAVTRELRALGDGLPEALTQLPAPPSPGDWHLLRELAGDTARELLPGQWESWRDAPDDAARLEAALAALTRFLGWPRTRPPLGERLDALAADFVQSGRGQTPSSLAAWLADERGWRPVPGDRSETVHADADRVLDSGEGAPALLAALFHLAAARLGARVVWCRWTGHAAMTRFDEAGDERIVDWKTAARALDFPEFLRMQGPSADAAERVLASALSTEEILHLVLVATAQSLSHSQDYEDALAVISLAQNLKTDTPAADAPRV